MAFLDNSGDIILDAVLTDTGRMRLAKGDGSFKIVKYAFSDDEIDYNKYDKTHASGSAYYDLDILQTPILEAFTNNASSNKFKLMSIPRTNLLYLPMLGLNELGGTDGIQTGGARRNANASQATDMFGVAVDEATEEQFFGIEGASQGVLYGANPANKGVVVIQIDQGLNTTEIPPSQTIDNDLRETHYIVEMDNRLGSIIDTGGSQKTPSFIDDDQIATYNFTLGQGGGPVSTITTTGLEASPIQGPRGTTLRFSIASSIELNTSSFLFTKLGTSGNTWANSKTASQQFRYIDSVVRITGATTGSRIDIPVRFIKKQS